jgi:hypothetical protein
MSHEHHHNHDAPVNDNSELPDYGSINASARRPKWFKTVSAKASSTHSRLPGLKNLPFPAVAIIALLIFVNICVWVAVGIVLVCSDTISTYSSLTIRSIIIRA